MALQTQRIDRDLGRLQPFQQAQHALAVFGAAGLPAHVIVVDQLGLGRGAAGGVEGDVDHLRPEIAGEHRLAHGPGVFVDGLVDHVPGADVRIVGAHRLDVLDQELFGRRGRARAEVVGVDPGGQVLRPVPQQVMAPHVQARGLGLGLHGVAAFEGVDARRRVHRVPLEFVLGHDQPALAGQQAPVARVGIGAVLVPRPPGSHRTPEPHALGAGEAVQGWTFRQGRRRPDHRASGCEGQHAATRDLPPPRWGRVGGGGEAAAVGG